ncbi:unnamed protein product [Darwinula stevensoni]|uniref:Uncharacterized protein n=1 Tax=Darwinula stevensoni TaxID=69355 RepID=A0A7R9A2V3_9CRUS|nr:unnamed protein product [Darwinula stevensoni]CAG0880253.1 unnamed protein product [Darwinula stevensoni]
MMQFFLRGTQGMKNLPEGIFGNVTFQEMFISDTSLETVDPSALLSSKDRLQRLTITNSRLKEFPFHVLPQMSLLRALNLASNALKSVTPLGNLSRQNLSLWSNGTNALQLSWPTSDLESLDISNNPISKLSPGLVEGMRLLTSFDASHCNLGPILRSGSLTFHSEMLSAVYLHQNNLTRLETGSIAGLQGSTMVYLSENNITDLTEGAFRPMLEEISQGESGRIILWQNPIQCDSWLGSSQNFTAFLARLLCPDAGKISPCTCYFYQFTGELTVDCSQANSSEIFSAFNNVSWSPALLTNYNIRMKFSMTGNDEVQELKKGAFGNVTFNNILIESTILATMDPSTLLQSKNRLETLSIKDSLLAAFPFHILPQMVRLGALDLSSNSLKTVPALASQSLQILSLLNNNISSLKPGWSVSNLNGLEIDNNPISKLPSGLVGGMSKLKTFSASNCNLGPTLSNGSLTFRSETLAAKQYHGTDGRIVPAHARRPPFRVKRANLPFWSVASSPRKALALAIFTGGFPSRLSIPENPIQCDDWLLRSQEFVEYLQRLEGLTCRICPNPDEISPCTCSSDSSSDMTVDCSQARSSEEISSAFGQFFWLENRFASDTVQLRFRMENNDAVEDLPEGVFGNASFSSMHIWNSAVVKVDPAAIRSSKDRLEELAMAGGRLEEFPFGVLREMKKLVKLQISSNALAAVPALESRSLLLLDLSNNQIGSLEPGWSLPLLVNLDIGGNPISNFPSGLVDGMANLNSFTASGCNLGPILPQGSLAFNSKSLEEVYLGFNRIDRVEPGAITGLGPDTTVFLYGNSMRKLTEDTFRPMLDTLQLGDGRILVDGNPMKCDASMAWLVLDPNFIQLKQSVAYISCADGSSLLELLILRLLHLVLPFRWVQLE